MDESKFLNGRLIVKVGDITKENLDAIVNAANSSLMGGGGVDGAIHRTGGLKILDECKEIRKTLPEGLETGKAVITTGGNLKAKYVIHTVGPVWHGGNSSEEKDLAYCYHNSLNLATQYKVKSIAFPAISTGIFGYPPYKAAQVSSKVIYDFLSDNKEIDTVVLVFFKEQDKQTFLENISFE